MKKVYNSVLVVLVKDDFSPNGDHLQVYDGQGIPSLNIRFSREARKDFPVGSLFIMDLVESMNCYSSYTKNLHDAYFGNYPKDLERIEKFIDLRTKGDIVGAVALKKTKSATFSVVEEEIPVPEDVKIDKLTWNLINKTVDLNKYPFLMGPRGCGKSTVAKAIAKSRGWQYFAFDMGQAIKPKKFFVGGLILGEGSRTEKVNSLFLKAFTQEEPTLIFLDEITRIPSIAANFLMTVLDRTQSYIYDEDTGEYYYKGKGVHFITAGNIGFSYTSTQQLDAAFEDRFIKIKLNYLSEAQEKQLILSRVKGITPDEADKLVKVAGLLRKAQEKGTLTFSLSTRQVLDAAELVAKGFTVKDIVNLVIINNYASTEEESTAKSVLQAL